MSEDGVLRVIRWATQGFGALLLAGLSVSSGQACPAGPVGDDFPVYGRWLGPYILHTVKWGIDPDDPTQPAHCHGDQCQWRNPCIPPDQSARALAHAMVLPRPPQAGAVLFAEENGQVSVWSEAAPDQLDTTIWCNPDLRGPSSDQWGDCKYYIFCAGHTTDRDGNFVFVGGASWNSSAGACATAYFDPTKLDGVQNPWTPGPNMARLRWYGSALALLKAFDGRTFILGGTEDTSQSASGLGVREWERLVPIPSTGTLTDCSQSMPVDCPAGLGLPPSTLDALLLDPGNPTEFEYYPRAHQLAGPYGDIFIAGDTQPSLVQCNGGAGNDEGEMWFLRPPLSGGTTGVLATAPFHDEDGGVRMNRYYGSSVMLHQLDENGGRNRVLVFGGSSGCVGGPNCVCPHSSGTAVQVRASVKELDYVPSAVPGAASTLITKTPLLCGRVFSNAVLLPTGEVFISRGASTNSYSTVATSDDTLPHLWAEIYNPGPSKASPGSTEWTARIPDVFTNYATCAGLVLSPNAPTPRIYHHIAILLPSGRVLVAGGDEVPGGNLASPLCGQYGTSSFTAEIYEPPYFHKGFSVKITSSEPTMALGSPTNVGFKLVGAPLGTEVDRVVFIRTGSVTHHQDASQVYVEAKFDLVAMQLDPQGNPVGILQATVRDPSLMPPGYFLMFVVGRHGADRVPSQGVFIKVD